MDALQELLLPGDHPVDVPITCAITRFGLRSPRHLLPMYRDYRALATEAQARQVPGLLRTAFLIGGSSSCFSMSIWAGPPNFSAAVPQHVDAARKAFGRLRYDEARGPELWSSKWRLESVSNNLNWGDFDLRHTIADHASTVTGGRDGRPGE